MHSSCVEYIKLFNMLLILLLLLLLFIHNHVALANEMVMWAIASHGGNRAAIHKQGPTISCAIVLELWEVSGKELFVERLIIRSKSILALQLSIYCVLCRNELLFAASVCGSVSKPTNGGVFTTGTTYGATASFSCDVGYNLKGSSSINCPENGTWSATPSCDRKFL